MKEAGAKGLLPLSPAPQIPARKASFASLRTIALDDSEHLLHNHHASVASLRLLFTFAPERRSASLRNQRSPSPEYPHLYKEWDSRVRQREEGRCSAYIPFYPHCLTAYQSDTKIADRPIRIFHGAPDDQNPVARCKAYVERLRSAGHDVQLTEYPNAQHSFDNPLGSLTPSVVKNSPTVRRCMITTLSS